MDGEFVGASSSTNIVPVKAEEPERWLQLQFIWSAKSFKLDIADSDRVFDLKAAIHNLTRVPPERQKILGLVKGKLPPDQDRISDLRLATGKKFTLVGTPEGDEIKDPSRSQVSLAFKHQLLTLNLSELENLPDVVNDLDVDFSDNIAASAVYTIDQRNIRKVKEATEKLSVNIIHPLRQGKKLLVLDIDYSTPLLICSFSISILPPTTAILDTKPLTSGTLPPAEFINGQVADQLDLARDQASGTRNGWF
ncbi:hypothetical protein C0991_002432 [Blastosporella zonata]|nr:hypothetical protein C0991_002432 [Blastosporella zonata]